LDLHLETRPRERSTANRSKDLRYLDTENTASFVRNVAELHTFGTLGRLAFGGGHILWRAAVMAVGLGSYSQNAILGALERQRPRRRLLADSGIRQLGDAIKSTATTVSLASAASTRTSIIASQPRRH
jgi:hypothetical protein